MATMSEEIMRLEMLRRTRTGKKTAITKRIARVIGMIEAGGCSRRQIKFLMEKLVNVYDELEGVCTEISQLSVIMGLNEEPLNNLEDVRMNVGECAAHVEEHLDS